MASPKIKAGTLNIEATDNPINGPISASEPSTIPSLSPSTNKLGFFFRRGVTTGGSFSLLPKVSGYNSVAVTTLWAECDLREGYKAIDGGNEDTEYTDNKP